MARSDQFSAAVTCPKCKKTGSITWQENENPAPIGGNLNTVVKNLSDGFRTAGREIHCTDCDVRAAIRV